MASILGYEIERALSSMARSMIDQTDLDRPTPSFTWQGLEIPCIPGRSLKGKLFGSGGFTPDANVELVVIAANLPDPAPQPDDFVTYNGDKYRIDLVKTAPDGALVTFVCMDPNRAAGVMEREM